MGKYYELFTFTRSIFKMERFAKLLPRLPHSPLFSGNFLTVLCITLSIIAWTLSIVCDEGTAHIIVVKFCLFKDKAVKSQLKSVAMQGRKFL